MPFRTYLSLFVMIQLGRNETGDVSIWPTIVQVSLYCALLNKDALFVGYCIDDALQY